MIYDIYVIWIKIFDGIESYLIKYTCTHNGWSCDFDIFGIPEVNF